jgi:hypothetical protein
VLKQSNRFFGLLLAITILLTSGFTFAEESASGSSLQKPAQMPAQNSDKLKVDAFIRDYQKSANYGEWFKALEKKLYADDLKLLSQKLSGFENEPLPKLERRGDVEFLLRTGSSIIRYEVVAGAGVVLKINNRKLNLGEIQDSDERWRLIESVMPKTSSSSLFNVFINEAQAGLLIKFGAKIASSLGLTAGGFALASGFDSVESFCTDIWEKYQECEVSRADLNDKTEDYDKLLTKFQDGKLKKKPSLPKLKDDEEYKELRGGIMRAISGIEGASKSSYKGMAAKASRELAGKLSGSNSVCPNDADMKARACAKDLREKATSVGLKLGSFGASTPPDPVKPSGDLNK